MTRRKEEKYKDSRLGRNVYKSRRRKSRTRNLHRKGGFAACPPKTRKRGGEKKSVTERTLTKPHPWKNLNHILRRGIKKRKERRKEDKARTRLRRSETDKSPSDEAQEGTGKTDPLLTNSERV